MKPHTTEVTRMRRLYFQYPLKNTKSCLHTPHVQTAVEIQQHTAGFLLKSRPVIGAVFNDCRPPVFAPRQTDRCRPPPDGSADCSDLIRIILSFIQLLLRKAACPSGPTLLISYLMLMR